MSWFVKLIPVSPLTVLICLTFCDPLGGTMSSCVAPVGTAKLAVPLTVGASMGPACGAFVFVSGDCGGGKVSLSPGPFTENDTASVDVRLMGCSGCSQRRR